MQQQQLHRLQQQIKTEPADPPPSQAHQEESKKKDEVANCVIGGPPPPVESLLAHINSQLETGGGIKAEIDSEFLKLVVNELGMWCSVLLMVVEEILGDNWQRRGKR